MTERQPLGYILLLGLTLCFSLAAIVTLLPRQAASKPNVFGYRSVCTYAPAATAVCGVLAGTTCVIRNRLVSRKRSATRFRPPIAAALVGLALVGLFVGGASSFGRAQGVFQEVIDASAASAAGTASAVLSRAADGTRRAVVSEGEVSATVEVTVTAGRLEGLSLIEGRNVEASVAEAIFTAVRQAQSTAVDAVSGATATSQVLLRAIEGALAASR